MDEDSTPQVANWRWRIPFGCITNKHQGFIFSISIHQGPLDNGRASFGSWGIDTSKGLVFSSWFCSNLSLGDPWKSQMFPWEIHGKSQIFLPRFMDGVSRPSLALQLLQEMRGMRLGNCHLSDLLSHGSTTALAADWENG